VIEEAISAIEDSVSDLRKKYYGVVTGRVINPLDPLVLGRVQVQLPFVDDLDLSPWARVATPMAGIASGFYFLPNVGDEVLVAFEHGDVNAPYIIGGLWSAMAPPPLPSPVPQIRTIRTISGNQITFTEIPPSILISTLSGQSILMSAAGVQIISAATTVLLGPAATPGLTITSGSNTITATPAGISIATGGNISLTAGGNIVLTAGGTCTITAPTVAIN
jgi:phage baseplate assembly protein gpV